MAAIVSDGLAATMRGKPDEAALGPTCAAGARARVRAASGFIQQKKLTTDIAAFLTVDKTQDAFFFDSSIFPDFIGVIVCDYRLQ